MIERLILQAKKVALKSEGVGRRQGYRVGSVLFDKRKRILSCRCNSYKTHPILSEFTCYPHLHAESAVVLHRGLDNCGGLSILTVRIKHPNAQLTMAKPCEVCYNLLSKVGIKDIYYTNWKGEIEKHQSN